MLWEGVLAQYVVTLNDETNSILGLVSAYGANARNRYAYLAVFAVPSHPQRALLLEGVGIFVNLLFRTHDLRKLYAETPEFAFQSFASGLTEFFQEEAKLRDHDYYDGQYWDLHILSISRDFWVQRIAPRIDELL
jgi:RimJ/RimL family protein N-acetyltransferase